MKKICANWPNAQGRTNPNVTNAIDAGRGVMLYPGLGDP